MRKSYDEWLRVVDAAVQRQAGCSVHDLADCCFADWYEDGMTASAAARKAIRAEMGEDE